MKVGLYAILVCSEKETNVAARLRYNLRLSMGLALTLLDGLITSFGSGEPDLDPYFGSVT